jgi:DNA-binding LacI/PurR family transcriptional regulator
VSQAFGQGTLEDYQRAERFLPANPERWVETAKAYEHQISIPLELWVVGFDDIGLSQFTIPPLTTVRMSQSELAKLALGALIAHVERDSALAACHEFGLPTHLVLRNTTALALTGA